MKQKVHYAILEDMKKYTKKVVNFNAFEETSGETDISIIDFLRDYYAKHLPVDVTAWVRVNSPDKKMIFKNRFSEQICFVRDVLSVLFFPSIEEYDASPVMVIGTHTSKSIELPVFQMKSEKYGIELILSNNFSNWKVSVKSDIPLDFDIMGLFDTAKVIQPYYCEGFPEEKVYGSYEQDHSSFTFEIFSDYNLYTFVFLLSKYLEKKVDAK